MLSDLGYDVWMGNSRGNRYSKNHTSLNSDYQEFWDFTFHEMGKYDLPANIDYILSKTGYEQLHYIGHSQGTAIFWVLCSEQPAYSQKITSMHALAPIAYIHDMKSPLFRTLVLFLDFLTVSEAVASLLPLPLIEFSMCFFSLSAGCHANAAHHRIHAQHQIPGGPQPGCVPRQCHDAGCLLEYPLFGCRLQLGAAEQGKFGCSFACFPQMFVASICICHMWHVASAGCPAARLSVIVFLQLPLHLAGQFWWSRVAKGINKFG